MHVRRPNEEDDRVEGTNTPNEIYLRIIDHLRKTYELQHPLFHIYSQGEESSFKEVFNMSDIVLHLNKPIEVTFPSFVFADILVTSQSSFSYAAALISDHLIYYMPFWHPPLPLPNWIILDSKNSIIQATL